MAMTALSAPIGARNADVSGTDSKWHNHPDTPIITAFYRWQRAHIELAALPDGKPEPGESYTPEQSRLWKIIDLADNEVGTLRATTPAGIICKLWLAIVHSADDVDVEHAAIRADLAWFGQQGDALNWNTRVIFEAIRSLADMAQAAPSTEKEG